MQQITVDITPSNNKKTPIFNASQYDVGREFRANLVDNLIPYTLDGTELLTVSVRKGDNTLFTADVGNTFGGKSYVDFVSTEQMCAVAGFSFGELSISKNNTRIGTINFTLMVEPSPEEGGVSQSEINNLARQVEELVDEEMGDYLLKTEAEETYATITALETLSGVVDTKASASDLETLAGVVDTKASKTYVDTQLQTKANASDVYKKTETYNKQEVDDKIAELPEPMIFKGTLGVGGTIQTLPTASASNEGFTYKVISDGTYAGQTAKVGDVFTSNGSAWVLIPSGDEDNDTWRAIKVNGVEKLDNGISSGSVDIVEGDNINITFDGNGNKVEIEADTIDDAQALTDKSWSGKKTYDEIVNILPTGNASGSIANFNTSLALPLVSAKFDFNATQEAGTPTPQSPKAISGVSAVSVIHCGANLWDEEWEVGDISASTGLPSSGTDRIRSKNYCSCKPSTSYYLVIPNKNLRFYFYDKNFNYIGYEGWWDSSRSYTTPNNAYYFKIGGSGAYGTTYNNDISVNYPATDTEYHAYNGSTTLINLGGTYYGGYVSQDKNGKRVLVVTNEYKVINGSKIIRDSGTRYHITKTNLGNFSSNGVALMNKFRNRTTSEGYNVAGTFFLDSNNLQMNADQSYASKDDFLNAYGEITICYTLETPLEPINLPDGEPIIAFNGVNNVYADSGDCEVTYKKSIDEAIAELQALILNA